jgi:hypothetical protein
MCGVQPAVAVIDVLVSVHAYTSDECRVSTCTRQGFCWAWEESRNWGERERYISLFASAVVYVLLQGRILRLFI